MIQNSHKASRPHKKPPVSTGWQCTCLASHVDVDRYVLLWFVIVILITIWFIPIAQIECCRVIACDTVTRHLSPSLSPCSPSHYRAVTWLSRVTSHLPSSVQRDSRQVAVAAAARAGGSVSSVRGVSWEVVRGCIMVGWSGRSHRATPHSSWLCTQPTR